MVVGKLVAVVLSSSVVAFHVARLAKLHLCMAVHVVQICRVGEVELAKLQKNCASPNSANLHHSHAQMHSAVALANQATSMLICN